MEAILQQLSRLTVVELKAKVQSCGQKPVPITKTTRLLIERRIAKYLLEQQGGGNDAENAETSQTSCANSQREDKTDGIVEKQDKQTSSVIVCSQRENGGKSQADVDTICNVLNSDMSPASKEAVVHYFAVCIPTKNDRTSPAGKDETDAAHVTTRSDEILIFQDRREALCIARRNKGARFKVFKTKQEAENFAKSNQDLITPKPSTETSTSQPIAEKPVSSFRSVKPQDLVTLRRTIESDDVIQFRELVWSNPRYLINAGDSPTILQEGSRYNALHVAAKTSRPEVCRLVLEIIQDPTYILLMYPDDPEDTVISRREYLTDLYLNSPEKGNGETPLHFASKFGNQEVVEVLVSHPQCDKMLKNKDGETASEIACTRSNLSGKSLSEMTEIIKDLLRDHYFVPVLRAEDNCTQPVIGEPWSPDVSEHQSSPLLYSRPAGESPIDAVLSLQAYAGPMSSAEAGCFRRNLQTPPSTERKRVGMIKRADGEKGVERIGRELAGKMHVSWAEYWNFLDEFVDLAMPNGLEKLEAYLAGKYSLTDEDKSTLGAETGTSELEYSPSSGQAELIVNLMGEFEKLDVHSPVHTNFTGNYAMDRVNNAENERHANSMDSNAERGNSVTTRHPLTVKCKDNQGVDETVENEAGNALETVSKTKEGEYCQTKNTGLDTRASTYDETDEAERDSLGEREAESQSADSVERTDCASLVSQDRQQNLSRDVRPSSTKSDSSKVSMPELLKTVQESETTLTQSKEPARTEDENTNLTVTQNERARSQDTHGSTACSERDETNSGCDRGKMICENAVTVRCTSILGGCGHAGTDHKDGVTLGWKDFESGDRKAKKSQETVLPSVSENGDIKDDVFRTPKNVSSRKSSSVVLGGCGEIGFILGPEPSKTDLHVWRALAGVEIPDSFPCIRLWKQLVSLVPKETRARWPTPARCAPARNPWRHPSQTPSPRSFRTSLTSPLLNTSPLALRARHYSEPVHRPREHLAGLRLQQARIVRPESLGELKARLFQE